MNNRFISAGGFVVLVISILFTACNLHGVENNNKIQPYLIDGTGTRRTYDKDGNEVEVYQYKFRVAVDGCRFQIIFDFPEKLNKIEGIPRYEWLYNGTNLLHSVSYPDKSNLDISNQEHNARVTCNAFVLSDSIPGSSGAANANLIWLIFASKCHTKEAQFYKNIRPPWQLEYAGLWETGLTLPCRIKPMDAYPNIPEEIVILSDGKIRFIQPHNSQPATIDAPEPYSNGFTNALIKITSTFATNGFTFPSAISFTRWFPDFNNHSNNGTFSVAESDAFTVTGISFENYNLPSTPKLKEKAIMFEQRPANRLRGFQVAYGIATNGNWLILSDPMVKMFESEWLRGRTDKVRSNSAQDSVSSRLFFAIIIIFITALSLIARKFSKIK